MFEKIILRRSEDGQLPTMGDLAEALLFYQHVHLVLDYSSLFNYVNTIGIEQLIQLLDKKTVSAVYCREMLGAQSQQIGALLHHNFVGMELAGRQDSPKRFTAQESIEDILKKTGQYSNRAARKISEKFLEKVPIRSLTGKDFLHGNTNGLIDAATADLYEPTFIAEAFSRTLNCTPGFVGLSSSLAIEVQPTHAGFTIFSNLDLKPTNEARARRSPALEPLTVAHLLSEIFSARSDTILAAHYGGDFRTSRAGSSIINLQYEELMRRSGINQNEVRLFQEVIVNEGRSLKEVIDKGERSFDEFLLVLNKATLFRNWSSGVHPDKSMVAEYLKEGSRQGWIESLPGKGLRFVIGSALDLKVPGAGTLFSLAESLLIEKMMKGWRPNHFVDRRLKPFVNV
ncbi:MAG TPA: hypothetical protein VGJ72_01580 [Polaromonas sp.]